MNIIDLETASSEILQACQVAEGGFLPYFILVGAGVSSPPVKLAWEIEEHCKDFAQRTFKKNGLPLSSQPMDTYSHWFSKAYRHPKHRQKYLRSLIEGKTISQANLRLAHLLLEKKIANLVVTTNFDDFLSRALTLFGRQHIVCDHPSTAGRIDPDEREDIQIVHVHGSYWFYDCANLSGAIAAVAKPSAHSILSMATLLELILWKRMPLVVGYSGWEGDVIMQALKRRLNTEIPYNLYWFCYNQSSTNSLPGWLTSNDNVYFVIPQARSAQVVVTEPPVGDSGASGITKGAPADAKTGATKVEAEPVLLAQQVFDKLIQVFDLGSPKLTSDPLGFFAEQLRSSLPQDDPELTAVDLYFIRSVVERIARARQREEEERRVKSTVEGTKRPRERDEAEKEAKSREQRWIEAILEGVREALRSSQYGAAIAQASEIQGKGMTRAQLRELLDAVWSATKLLNDNSEEELRGCDVALGISKRLRRLRDPDVEVIIANALLRKGVILNALGKIPEGISAYDEVVRRFEHTEDPRLQERIATALLNKGNAMDTLDRSDEEMAAYDEVIKRFADATDSTIKERVAIAWVNKGLTLGTQGKREEEVATYAKVIEQFGAAPETSIRDVVADALLSKGLAFGELGLLDDELAAYDEVIGRLAGATDSSPRERVMAALFNKGIALDAAGRHQEAVAACDELIERFSEATELSLREAVAQALINKGVYLGKLGRTDEETSAYEDVVRRFGAATETALQEQVATAQNAIALRFIFEGKRARAQGDERAARERFENAQARLSRVVQAPGNPTVMASQGYVAFLLGDRDRGVSLLTEAIESGGEEIREAKLRESDIDSVSPDEEFQALLRAIPARATTSG